MLRLGQPCQGFCRTEVQPLITFKRRCAKRVHDELQDLTEVSFIGHTHATSRRIDRYQRSRPNRLQHGPETNSHHLLLVSAKSAERQAQKGIVVASAERASEPGLALSVQLWAGRGRRSGDLHDRVNGLLFVLLGVDLGDGGAVVAKDGVGWFEA